MTNNSERQIQWVESFPSKYLDFRLAKKQNPSSWVVDVFTNGDDDILLGQVRYYANWRQYGFYPNDGTVFEKTCLTDLAEFCRSLNERQRAGIKPEPEMIQTKIQSGDSV